MPKIDAAPLAHCAPIGPPAPRPAPVSETPLFAAPLACELFRANGMPEAPPPVMLAKSAAAMLNVASSEMIVAGGALNNQRMPASFVVGLALDQISIS